MTALKLYVAGPMTGIEDHNFPAFIAAENKLRKMGHEVVSPREITLQGEGKGLDMPWSFYLRNDLKGLLECDGIALLPGWKASRGARLECMIADKLDMWVYQLNSSMELSRTRMGYQGV